MESEYVTWSAISTNGKDQLPNTHFTFSRRDGLLFIHPVTH